MNNLIFLLEGGVNTKIGETAGQVADAAGNASGGVTSTFASNPLMLIILYCAVIFGALYFFSIRPQKKREKEIEEMRSQIKPGDSVLLNNGMFGIVVDITAECFIIEFGTNKCIRIPVMKQEVATKKVPNLSNKEEKQEVQEPEKKSLFGFEKKEKKEE